MTYEVSHKNLSGNWEVDAVYPTKDGASHFVEMATTSRFPYCNRKYRVKAI